MGKCINGALLRRYWSDPHSPDLRTVAGSSRTSSNIYFVDIGHEIFFTPILFLPLIQEVQLSVTGETMCTKY